MNPRRSGVIVFALIVLAHGAGPVPAAGQQAAAAPNPSRAGCDGVAYRVAGEGVNLDDTSSGHFATPPNPDGPTVADLSLFIIDVTDIDEVGGTFAVEGFLDLVWCDPRLAFDVQVTGVARQTFLTSDAALKLEQIWWPDLLIANSTSGREASKQLLKLSADGTVEYEERFSAVLEARYDLRRFPFDRQSLPIVIESFAWSSDSLAFHAEGDKFSFGDEFEIPEWHTRAVRSRITSKQEVRDRAPFSRFALEIDVNRRPAFYLWKLLIPLVLLVAISWSVFWLDSANLAERLGVSFTSILTVVAYQFIVADYLPRISYLTFMDAVLFTSFTLMVLTVVENVWANTSTAGQQAGTERVTRLDRACRWLFPAVYGGLLAILALVYLA